MINLMPTELKDSIRYARLNNTLVQYMMVSIGVVALVSIVMLFGYITAQQDEAALKESIAQKEASLSSFVASEEEARNLSKRIDTVGKLLDREVQFSVILQETGSILPEGSVLTSLSLSNDNTEPLTLSALVDDKQTAAVLRQNIEDSDLFASADIESIVASLDDKGNTEGFNVSIIATPTNLSANQQTPPGSSNSGNGNE